MMTPDFAFLSRRPAAAAYVRLHHQENADMQTAVHPTYPRRGGQVQFYLVFGATYPLFLAAEGLRRWLAGGSVEGSPPAVADHSVFAAARESTFIAISYALMARTTLRRVARQNRAERLS